MVNSCYLLNMELVTFYLYWVNIFTFYMFARDKHRAVCGKWRIPEWLLLFLCYLGGALGGFAAMWLFSHKTQRPLFTLSVSILLGLLIVVSSSLATFL